MRILSTLVSLFFLSCIILFFVFFVAITHYSIGLPNYKELENYRPPVTTRLYAQDGSLLSEYATQKRSFVPIDKIPQKIKQAFISAEDKNFYSHSGIDFFGIARAILVNIQNFGSGKRMMGASTITQQVAKNFFFSPERTFSRKIKEALLARRIESSFEKNHILELYLNEIYLGQGAYGVASAAMTYFDKSMNDLTLGEAAYLAALPKAPNNYHPVKNEKAAFERRNWVLSRMKEDGYITQEEYELAKKEKIYMNGNISKSFKDGLFFSEEVRRFVVNKYGEESINLGGLTIKTSLNPKYQTIASKVMQDGLLSYDKRHGWRGPIDNVDTMDFEVLKNYKKAYIPRNWKLALVNHIEDEFASILFENGDDGKLFLQDILWAKKALEDGKILDKKIEKISDVLNLGDIILVSNGKNSYKLEQIPEVEGAMVVLDPHTGRVYAMIGGFSFEKSQFNRVVQAKRQPGSSFKPFVYLSALDSGYTPSSLVLDAPIVMEKLDGTKWKPQNYSRQFYGPTTLRVGIEKSRNLMTVRLAQALGIPKILNYAKKFGISDQYEPSLSTVLGSGETTLYKLVAAYGMLVNGGKKIEPSLVDRIQDRSGKTIYQKETRVCSNCRGDELISDEMPKILDDREQIQDPVSAYQMVNILSGVVERGTGKSVRSIKKTLGAKSGTSNESKDAWFIGFSPDLVVGVWVGFDNPKTLGPHDTGGVVAAPIFKEFMRLALENVPDTPFRVPKDVKLVRVNASTGRPASMNDTNVILEAFRKDTDLSKPEKIIGQDISIKEDEIEPDLGGLY